MAGGASQAPKRKSLPGVAMANRIRSPWSWMPLNSGHDHGEDLVVARVLSQLAHVEQVGTIGIGDRPVVVLAAAVHLSEGLLLHKTSKAVLGSSLLYDLHHHEVLVDLGGHSAEQRGELKLVGSNLSVAGL